MTKKELRNLYKQKRQDISSKEKLKLDDCYGANGREIYHIDMDSAEEGLIDNFHSPRELWNKAFPGSL